MSVAAVEAVRNPDGVQSMAVTFDGTLRYAKSVGVQHANGPQLEHSKSPDGVRQQEPPVRESSVEILEPPDVQSGSAQKTTAGGGKNIPKCPICGVKSNFSSLELHIKNHGKPGAFRCAVCDVWCPSKDARKRHEVASHLLVRDQAANAVPGAVYIRKRFHAKLKLTKNFAEVQKKAKSVGKCTVKRTTTKKTAAKSDRRSSGPKIVHKQKGHTFVIRDSIVNFQADPQQKPPEPQATSEKQQTPQQKSAGQPQTAKKKPEESCPPPAREKSGEDCLLRAMGKMRELVFLDANHFEKAADRVIDEWEKDANGRLLVVRSYKKHWKGGLKPAATIGVRDSRSNFVVFTKSGSSNLVRDFMNRTRVYSVMSGRTMLEQILYRLPFKDAFIAAHREDREKILQLHSGKFRVYHA